MTGNPDLAAPFDNCQKHVKRDQGSPCKDAGSNDHGTDTRAQCFCKWKPEPDLHMEGKRSFCDHDPSGKRGLLVNETTGKTGTGNVSVKGGEKFHLEATTQNIGSLKGKYAITSNYPLNFHAMLLKLANSQDIGFGYYTDTLELNLEVDWPDEATVKIIKKIREATRSLQVPFTASMQMKPARNLSKKCRQQMQKGNPK